jgi:hypothetical protein
MKKKTKEKWEANIIVDDVHGLRQYHLFTHSKKILIKKIGKLK